RVADLASEIPRQDQDDSGLRLRDLLRRVDRYSCPGRERSLLVRVAVDRVVEEVLPDPAIVEQGVALARGAVAHDLLAVTAQSDEQVEQCVLRPPPFFREPLL